MNFDLHDDQMMMSDSFARFLDRESSMARVRAAMPSGFDPALWSGLAQLGAFAIRVPEAAGGLGLNCLDACLLLEDCGRALASGPVAETIVAARVLALVGGEAHADLLADVLAGKRVLGLAFRDLAETPVQAIAGGLAVDAVIAHDGERVVLTWVDHAQAPAAETLASTALGELDLSTMKRIELDSGGSALATFRQGLEEWKLLIAAALSGLAREAIRLAAKYAAERKQFGQPIGVFQAISHPLADCITAVDGSRYFLWKVLRDIADGAADAGAKISLAAWYAIETAGRCGYQAVHTFGGYGLTTEYDVHLYNLRAKAWPLVYGDPVLLLEEAGRRLYSDEATVLPDVGEVAVAFGFGDEARDFAAEVSRFFVDTLTAEHRQSGKIAWEAHDPELHRKLAEADLLFPAWPKEAGGRGVGAYAMAAARDVWSEHEYSGSAVGVTTMVAAIISRFGSDDIKRDVLPSLQAGLAICSLGFSEPGSGSDVFAAECRSIPDGNGWRINGTKMFTSGADIADYVLLLTRSDATGRKHEGLTMFIVPLKDTGVEVQPIHTFIDERTNVTFYDDVKVPDSYRLGEVGQGLRVMAASLSLEHSGAAFTQDQRKMVLAAEAVCRAVSRNGRPFIEDSGAQCRLARAYAHVEITRMISHRALWAGANNEPDKGFGAMCKLFSSETFRSDAADLLDLTAPYSLFKHEGPASVVNLAYRHAQGTTVYGGTSEIHRSMIAERNLGLPRSRGK